MSFADLPPELVEALVDHMQDDSRALREVSTVAKAWYPRTRKHLFQSLDIGQRPGLEGRYGELKDLLISRPDLCGFVHHLSVVLRDSDKDGIASPNFFPAILPFLTSIRELKISGGDEGISWTGLPEPVQHALQDLAFRPTIAWLDLQFVCNFPVSRLAHSIGLSKVKLAFVFPEEKNQDLSLTAPPPPFQMVEHSDVDEGGLAIYGDSSYSLFLILQEAALSKTTPPFINPRRLILGYPFDDQGLANRWDAFMTWCSSSVQDYEFYGGASTPHFTRFTSFPNLRELNINIPARLNDFWIIMTSFLEELVQCTSSRTPSTLETINITITSLDGCGRPIEQDDILALLPPLSDHPCWRSMERHLVSRTFSVLKMVRIGVHLVDFPVETHETWIEFLEVLETKLQVLCWKNLLVIQVFPGQTQKGFSR